MLLNFNDFTCQIISSEALCFREYSSLEYPENSEKEINPEKEITLGYCPTMSERARKIKSENDAVVLKGFGSTAQAFSSLNVGTVDAVLVGRLFEDGELENPFEMRLRGGFTLAGRNKRLIRAEELKAMPIHTAAGKSIAEEYLPDSENIIFHDSLSSAIEEGIDDAVLISWDDFPESGLSLVIPIDSQMNKIEKFRIPVIYSYSEEIIQGF